MSNQKIPWLEKHLRLITLEDDAKKVFEQNTAVFGEIHPWALLKLVSLRYLGSMYASIIRRCVEKGYFKKMCYVDFFAGPGVNRVRNSPALCYGSPLIMNELNKERPFDKMFLNDSDVNNTRAIDLRLKRVEFTEYHITNKDANLCVKKIVPEINEKCHSLIFIDPYSTEFSWNSMEEILNVNADIFFLFQTSLMPRGIPVATSPDAKIKNFFSDYNRVLEACQDDLVEDKRSAIFEVYKEDVQNVRGSETLMESIRIRGVNFYYDMLFVTRKTRGENPWFRAVTGLKKKIESYNSESVDSTLDIILGRQIQLTRWYEGGQSTLF